MSADTDSSADGDTPADNDDQEDDDRRRKAVIWFLVVFLVVLLIGGGAAMLGGVSFGGTGELTVSVTDQDGDAASGQQVQIVDPTTGDVIATGTTDDNGEAEFVLDQGEYEVVVGESEQDVSLGEQTTVDLTVDTSPPELN